MAGAGIAGIGDFSALYTNPAGLGYLRRSQVAGSFSVLGVEDDARYEAPPLDEGNIFANTQRVTEYGLGNLGLAYKFPTRRGSLVLAGGVNQTATFERTLDYVGENAANSITDTFLPQPGNFQVASNGDLSFDFDGPLRAFNAGAIEFIQEDFDNGNYPFIQAVAPGTLIEQSDEVIEEGQLTEASFGGAVEAAEGVMIGASINTSFGTYRFTRFYQEIDFNNENTPELYEVAVDGGFLRGFDQLDVEETITSDLVGVNFRGGLTAEFSPNLRAGFMLETPTWYAVDETFGTRVTTFFDEGGSLSDGQLGGSEFDYSVRTPWRVGGGVALSLGDLHLTGDVELIDWTQLRLSADDVEFADVNRNIRDFNAVVNRRVGAEYRFDDLTVRGGIAYQPDPRDVEIQLPDDETTDRSSTFYAAGFSYRFDAQFRLDFSWMQERFDDQYRPYASVTVPGEVGEDGNPVSIVAPFVDEEIIRNQFLIGITYSF
jgi:long-subunit fatty acid transport protein